MNLTEEEKFLYDVALVAIKIGDVSLTDIIDYVLSAREEEGYQRLVDEDWLVSIIEEEHKTHLEESKSWVKPTQPDLLWKAFDRLNKQGIIALHNAGYTSSDALYDIGETWKEIKEEGGEPIGYCYYHGQDLERAITNNMLSLAFYGDEENNEKKAIAIGTSIVKELKDKGFEVDWNGTAESKIIFPNFEWNNLFVSDDDTDDKWSYDRAINLVLAK